MEVPRTLPVGLHQSDHTEKKVLVNAHFVRLLFDFRHRIEDDGLVFFVLE
jgi:hypothetical protein